MSDRITILVDGVDEPEVRAQIEQAVRDSFRDMSLPGVWRVAVKPSPVSGRWDFCVEGVDVRHTMSIAVPAALLPALIPRRLVESLNRTVAAHVESAVRRTLLRVV
jgi:hypothetical protein